MDIKNYIVGIYTNRQVVGDKIRSNPKIDYLGLFGYNILLSAVEAGLLAILGGGLQAFMAFFVIMYVARLSGILAPILAEFIAVRISKADVKLVEIINIQPYLWSLSTVIFVLLMVINPLIYLLPVVTLVGIFVRSKYYSEKGHVNFNKVVFINFIALFLVSTILR